MPQSEKFCLQCWLWRKLEMKKYLLVLLIFSLLFISACAIGESDELENSVENSLYETGEVIPDGLGVELMGLGQVEEVTTGVISCFWIPGYDNVYEMAESAALIIHGKIMDERVELMNVNTTLDAIIAGCIEDYEKGLMSREELDESIDFYHNRLELFEPRYDYVIIYSIEIIEIFQGDYAVGDVVELTRFMRRDENGNRSLEYSVRYDISAEYILFLSRDRTQNSGYLLLNFDQAMYKVPVGLTDEQMILEPECRYGGAIYTGDSDYLDEPFDINLEILREIAEENGLWGEDYITE